VDKYSRARSSCGASFKPALAVSDKIVDGLKILAQRIVHGEVLAEMMPRATGSCSFSTVARGGEGLRSDHSGLNRPGCVSAGTILGAELEETSDDDEQANGAVASAAANHSLKPCHHEVCSEAVAGRFPDNSSSSSWARAKSRYGPAA